MAINKRNSRLRMFVLILGLLFFLQGCSVLDSLFPVQQLPDQGNIGATLTAAYQELQNANSTLTALAALPTATDTPIPPTAEPTWTPTWTPTNTMLFTVPPPTPPVVIVQPTVIVVTATPGPGGQPRIYSSVNTNCRACPDVNCLRLGYLLVGEESFVFGRNSSSTWWFIREPRRNVMCWVWGGSTSVLGDTSQVPIVRPSATPLGKGSSGGDASFAIQSIHTISCSGNPAVILRVKNTGDKRLESAWMRIRNLTTDKVIFGPSSSNNPFRSSGNDCSAGGDYLNPGNVTYIGGNLGNINIHNDNLQITLELCTGEGLSGACDTDTTTYKAP